MGLAYSLWGPSPTCRALLNSEATAILSTCANPFAVSSWNFHAGCSEENNRDKPIIHWFLSERNPVFICVKFRPGSTRDVINSSRDRDVPECSIRGKQSNVFEEDSEDRILKGNSHLAWYHFVIVHTCNLAHTGEDRNYYISTVIGFW